jgi:MFS family permease
VSDSLAALRHRDFRFLVAGTATSGLGNAVAPIALAFAVLDLGGSAAELGLVVAAFALAEVVTTLFGGVLGDRVPRQLMMEGSAAASAVVQLVLATLLLTDRAGLAVLAVLGAVNGCLGALGQPSSQAMTRLTVPPEDLRSAVSVRPLVQTTAAMVGFALGGVLVAAVGSGWAIALDAATYAVAAFLFTRLRVPHVRPGRERTTMRADLAEGLREVLRHAWLWLLILQALLYHLFFGGAQSVLGPIVVGDELGRSSWGIALGALMAGFVAGGLVCLRWRPRRSLYVATPLLALTAAFPLVMALSDQLAVVVLGAFVHGFGLQCFDVFWNLAIQTHVPEDKLARVYSFDLVGSFVARPIGLALTGPIAEVVGYRAWLLVVAAIMGVSALAALLSADVRRLESAPVAVPL